MSNQSLAEQYADALTAHAEAKNRANVAEKMAKRVYAEVFLRNRDAKNIEERKQMTAIHPEVQHAENAAMEAESAANMARAVADGLEARFDEWRTRESTSRAEMALAHSGGVRR